MNRRTPFLTLLLLLSLIVASALGLQAAAVPAFQSQQATAATPYVVTLPFELNGRHIILKGKVNGKPLTFVFDTGDQIVLRNIFFRGFE